MKKRIVLTTIALLLMGCSNGGVKDSATTTQTSEQQEVTEVKSNDYFTLNGICVDNSYVDEDDSALKMVYLFFTVNAQAENLQIDDKDMVLTINDTNQYTSEHYPTASATKYTSNYYYSEYLEDIYTGSSLNVLTTFKIPEGDLGADKSITLSDTQIPDIANIKFSTNDISYLNSPEEVAQTFDASGYETAMNAYNDADADRIALGKSYIAGYQWEFTVNSTYYELEFWQDDYFELRVPTFNVVTPGRYSIKNGYIVVTNDSNGVSTDIPYTLEDNDINLDVVSAYDVSK